MNFELHILAQFESILENLVPLAGICTKRIESNETVGQSVKKYAGSWEFEQRMSRFLFGIHIHILDHLVVLSKLQNTRKMID